jgi:RNA polymerase sigma-70 factor, ECF subfamily
MRRSGREFDEVLGHLVRPGYELAVAMLGDRGLAEDAVQEAAVQAWRKLDHLKDRSAIRPWFLSIVANQCRTTRRRRWWSVLKLDDLPEPWIDPGDDQMLDRLDLDRALDALDANDRLVLYLHYYMDLTYEQVGRATGLSMTAARSRVHRATGRLRPVLAEMGVAYDAP